MEKRMSSLENEAAPPFVLEGSDGKLHDLKDYIGKTIVLYFYPKDNTSGCTKEACGFRDLKPLFDGLGVVLFGISRDSLKSHDKFIRDFGLPFILLSDPEAVMMKVYGAYGEKVQYGKKSMGTIRSTVVIDPDGKVIKHWGKVAKAQSHPAEVLEFLKKRASAF
jgi:thioredoxin-dependent peroxiredoxin